MEAPADPLAPPLSPPGRTPLVECTWWCGNSLVRLRTPQSASPHVEEARDDGTGEEQLGGVYPAYGGVEQLRAPSGGGEADAGVELSSGLTPGGVVQRGRQEGSEVEDDRHVQPIASALTALRGAIATAGMQFGATTAGMA